MASILPPAERRSVVLVTAYAALSLLLLLVGERLPTSALRGAGAVLFAPFDRVVLAGDRMVAAWRENTALHERIAALEADNARLRGAAVENRELRAQLDLPAWRGLPLRPVEILAFGGDPGPTSATLSAGARQGVHVGDAVLTSDGLIGRVIEVYGNLSRAALVTDPNLAVSCEVETTGVHGILRFVTTGTRPRLVVSSVPISDTIRVGEALVTSDLSVRFPRGIPVGRVAKIAHDATGLMQEIEVTPAAQLARLRHAFVTPGPHPPEDGLLRPHIEHEPVTIRPAARALAPAAARPAHAVAPRVSTPRESTHVARDTSRTRP